MSKKYIARALKHNSDHFMDIKWHHKWLYTKSSMDNLKEESPAGRFIRCKFCLNRAGHTRAGRTNEEQQAFIR